MGRTELREDDAELLSLFTSGSMDPRIEKINITVPSSAVVERVFSADVLGPENFEHFVLLRENEKCLLQSFLFGK